MANSNAILNILIKAKDDASGQLGKIKSTLGSVLSVAERFAPALAGVFSVAFFKKAVDDAEALETQIGTLEAVIRSTGSAAGLTADDIVEMSKRLDEATLGSAEGFRKAAGELLTFKSVGKDSFETTLKLAQDLAQIGIGTLESNTLQLGKALEDPVKGLTALNESGVTFTETQQEMIKSLVETGDKAKAQGLILEALTNQVGGAGSGAGGGLAGAVDLVGKRFTDFREKLGRGMLAPLTSANNVLADFIGNLNNSGVVEQFGNAIAAGFGKVVEFSQAAFNSVRDFYDALSQTGLIDQFSIAVSNAFNLVSGLVKSAIDYVGDFWNEIGKSDAIGRFSTAMTTAIQTVIDLAKTLATPFVELFALLTDTNAATSFGATLGAELVKLLDLATAFANAFGTGIKTIETAFYGLAGAGAKFFEAIMTGIGNIEAGFAKITFGDVSERWAAEAEKSQAIAEAFAASAELNFGKAEKALEQTAEKAQATRDSFKKLADGSHESAEKIKDVAEQVENVTEKATLTADELDALGESAQVVDGKLINMSRSADNAGKKITGLGASSQKAAKSLKDTADATDEVEQAFKELGITSQAELNRTAQSARQAFETIKNSGTASATDISNAYAAYAEKAIAANGGVADSALQVEAANYNIEIAAEEAGQAIVQNMNGAISAYDNATQAAERLAAANRAAAAERKQQFIDEQIAASDQALADSVASVHQPAQRRAPTTSFQRFTASQQEIVDQLTPQSLEKVEQILNSKRNELPGANLSSTLGLQRSIQRSQNQLDDALRRVLASQKADEVRRNQVPNTALTNRSQTMTVNLNIGGRTLSGQFADNEQTRAMLRELERASATVQ